MRKTALCLAAFVLTGLGLEGCDGLIHLPRGATSPDGGTSGTDGGSSGMGVDAGYAFTPDPPSVYVAKVKNVLVGLPLDAAELAAVEADPTQLGNLVDTWMQLPEYQTKMLRFFELAFQQTQITDKDFSNEIFPASIDSNTATQPMMLQNLQESFARTMLLFADAGIPFNQAMSTQTFAMTTAVKSFYAFSDSFQVGNAVGCGLGSGYDYFKAANPSLQIYVTATTSIPLSDTLDAGSPNYMHWYDPDVATSGCASDPVVFSASAPALYELLHGDLRGATNGQCTGYSKETLEPLQPADYQDWRMTTVTQVTGSQTPTAFYDLDTLRTSDAMALRLPHVGFFTTPAFFANWQTNASNQMRVTINQTFIVATGAQVDGTDGTSPPTTPGLDAAHAAPGTACFFCHQLLDPSRSIFAATYSWDYGHQPDATYANQPGLFAFEGVIAPMHTIYDLGKTLASHRLVAPGWAQKLCYYVNSEPCVQTDPAFQAIVSLFQSSDYSWNQLVKAVVTSPITTHAAASVTTTANGEVVAVSRRDHLCAALNARLGLTDVCGLNAAVPPVLPSTALAIVPGFPSDGYSRGSVVPVLPTAPTLFFRGGTENFCEAIATLLIDNANPPVGAVVWSSSNSAAAIADFVSLVMGVPASDPRNAGLQQLLTSHLTAAKQVTGISATAALQSTFMAACMSPSTVSIGM
jgi:hypothetical protein